MEKLKKIISCGLIAFALISIGFALGKNSVSRDRPMAGHPVRQGEYVAVYYLHSTYRCVTCNTIEKMTRALLDKSYSRDLAEGKILWLEADFQADESLSRQFEVVASCVVVAVLKDGRVTDYKRLDDVWTLMNDTQAFNLYVSETIDSALKRIGVES
jgi:hypothetical protein